MDKSSKIYVAGHKGMVGSAIVRLLIEKGYTNVVTATRQELDLRNQKDTDSFFDAEKPEYVFLAAGTVGGIMVNQARCGDFIYDNLAIQNNVLHAAKAFGVKKLLFLGTSCIYPKFAPVPIKESDLLTGALEPSNEAYAVAKIAGITTCKAFRHQYGCNFIAAMPTNLYGPNDNYDLFSGHVLPALLRKFHEAKIRQLPTVRLLGTGIARREFLHVDDCAEACLMLMQEYNESHLVNIGYGSDITIAELADIIQKIVGFEGKIEYDLVSPNGTPRKQLDSTRINSLGWKPRINLIDGIASTYKHYKDSL